MPWCAHCEAEYDTDGAFCPVCGEELSELPPERMAAEPFWAKTGEGELPWPVTETGEPEQAVFLANVSDTGVDAELIVGMLRAFGVPVVRGFREDGQLGKIILGFSGYGESLYVPAGRLELARELLKPSEEEDGK